MAIINSIPQADSGRIWISSYMRGLSLFDPSKGAVVKHFTEKNGLICDILGGIQTDGDGNLWIASQRGHWKVHHTVETIGICLNFTFSFNF